MKSIRVVAGKKTFCRRGHQRTAAFTGRCYRKDAGSIVHTLYERITTGRMDDPTPSVHPRAVRCRHRKGGLWRPEGWPTDLLRCLCRVE